MPLLILVVTCLVFVGVLVFFFFELHRFFVAISRVVVNHDDFLGTSNIQMWR